MMLFFIFNKNFIAFNQFLSFLYETCILFKRLLCRFRHFSGIPSQPNGAARQRKCCTRQ